MWSRLNTRIDATTGCSEHSSDSSYYTTLERLDRHFRSGTDTHEWSKTAIANSVPIGQNVFGERIIESDSHIEVRAI